MNLVIDASILIKWLLPERENEADTDKATNVMQAIVDGEIQVLQPIHWLAETSAVLSRLSSQTAKEDITLLYNLALPIVESELIYQTASQLAIQHKHHLFDTLYHAVALTHSEFYLLTADERYWRKTGDSMKVKRLADF